MRSAKKRSLPGVNEHFEGEHNAEIHFLFSLFVFYAYGISLLTDVGMGNKGSVVNSGGRTYKAVIAKNCIRRLH